MLINLILGIALFVLIIVLAESVLPAVFRILDIWWPVLVGAVFIIVPLWLGGV